jgi:hypothetical protein
LPRLLRQNDLAIHVGHHQPFQVMPIGRLSAILLLDTPYEVRADGMWRQSGAVDSHSRATPTAARTAAQPAHRFSQYVVDAIVRQAAQEAINGGVVGHARQSQDRAQLAMLAQAYFLLSFAGVAFQTASLASHLLLQ